LRRQHTQLTAGQVDDQGRMNFEQFKQFVRFIKSQSNLKPKKTIREKLIKQLPGGGKSPETPAATPATEDKK